MNYVPAIGSKKSPVAIIGEGPGGEENRQKLPFVGPAGQLLKSCVKAEHLEWDAFYRSNFLHERPPDNNIKPWFSEGLKAEFLAQQEKGNQVLQIAAGWDKKKYRYFWLTDRGMAAKTALIVELAQTDAKVIVALGGTATFALTGMAPITKIRGAPARCPELPGRVILPTIHPAACLRTDEDGNAGKYLWRFDIQRDLAKAVRFSRGFEWPNPKLIVEPTYTQTMEYISDAHKYPLVSFDIELVDNSIPCISLAFRPNEAISIPFMQTYGKVREREVWKKLKELFEN
ncbi:MAG TPA: hypothetical protein ENI09_01505, partial [candidate division WWE3 bacterium]|nr:hypothetical protein [candidate division WWE3 bacterium]